MAEPLFEYPDNWLRGTLEPNSILGLIDNVESGGTPSTKNNLYWGGDFPWLTPKEVARNTTRSIFFSRTERYLTKQGLENSSAKLLPVGTVLLTSRAPVGKVAICAVPMSTNQGFLNFQCGRNLRPLFLANWLKVNHEYLNIVANGSTYPELYKSDLFEFEIAVPTIEIQDKIISIINAIQFIVQIGFSVEQSMNNPNDVKNMQDFRRRLIDLENNIIPMLISGGVSADRVKTEFLAGTL